MVSLRLKWATPENGQPSIMEDKVKLAQSGDELLRHELISGYQPFVKKVISKVCRRYINESMDEYSVGLLAFNEAIDQFQSNQGSKFLTFANMVIRRRVIDHIRREQRQNQHIVLPYEEDEDFAQEENYAEQRASIAHYEIELQREQRMDEIEDYQMLLQEFGITFSVLSKQCPKHIDARDNAKEIARLLATDSELSEYLMQKKRLPMRKLEELVSCSRKTIERNRKYIIAVALIYLKNFHALQSYIDS
ncbi:RNA polymerase sigma-I factor [Aureibacillus halotolerans]|uniref:RNA polymerase sigma factor SigI n=1 Tax=Aureibacillus halotolerans TaxID=1508390 RepID=A0A4R6U447_9BACI|nr:RNA polymerase sigma-I factor [Aureibacillus halotolerans]TDQ40466.1 RNA polymerase sigma factor [Aureibacillus halotolerans]